MKAKRTVFILMVMLVLTVIIFTFFHKMYLRYDNVCEINNGTEFFPNAYVVINSEEKLKDFLFLNEDTKACSNDFELSKYTYVVVYGKPVKSMFYSYKTTYFDDISASYAPHWNSKVLFLEYEDKPADGVLRVYKMDKNDKIRGFFGI